MVQQAVIGIDIGTTSTKTVAFSTAGKVLFQQTVEYPTITTDSGLAEQDPELVFRAVLESLRVVLGQLHIGKFAVEGFSFSSAMHSLIAVDEAGNLLTNCIIWADTRSNSYVAELKDTEVGRDIYASTGTPLHPMSPLLKLCWMRDHLTDVFYKAAKFIGIKEYVWYMFFGEYVTDYSIASATGLFNIYTLQWHAPALEVADISAEKLPTPVPTTHTCRNLNPVFAAELGLAADVPFVVGASDGCLANLGTGAIRSGHTAVTIGTSGAIRVVSNKAATDPQGRIFSYILTPGHFVLGGAVNNGGVALRWFRDNFGETEMVEALKQQVNPYVLLCNEAATVPVGADGLIFLPYLLGERAPIWDANARGCFFGVHLNHKREHFIRALLEGVIFSVYSVGKALEETVGPVSVIYASGGFSRSEVWVQMLADIFNKKVLLAETPEGSAFGAAIMGMYALGIVKGLEEAEQMVHITRTFVPNEAVHQQYQKNFSIFEALYPKLKDSFSQISSLQAEE
ncbi:gluconokinase [Pontibacter harenae]|uniref:gluconokinase n=1 Tax=Pontibacter harenae TaxID=2894083 RepID=UPI001E4E006B|nr:gluconokinase [Pontibacter harenae]MCC9166256.1 gluconokinase [Pontibacter harenae]